MKRHLYLLLISAVLVLQACGAGADPAPGAQNGSPELIPGAESDGPYDPSLIGSALSQPFERGAGCTAETTDTDSFAAEVVRLVNVERTKAKLSPLTSQAQLTAAAQAHALDMGCNFFQSHTGSNGSTPSQRIAAAGYLYSNWLENVAVWYPTPAQVMTAWMNSPTHKANILSAAVTQIGIGYVYNPNDTRNSWFHYWAMDFGKPR